MTDSPAPSPAPRVRWVRDLSEPDFAEVCGYTECGVTDCPDPLAVSIAYTAQGHRYGEAYCDGHGFRELDALVNAANTSLIVVSAVR